MLYFQQTEVLGERINCHILTVGCVSSGLLLGSERRWAAKLRALRFDWLGVAGSLYALKMTLQAMGGLFF